MDFIDLAARPVLLVARFLLWLVWDLLFYSVAWSIGWPVLRVLTLGRFPHVGIREYDASGVGEAFIVCGTGIAVLVAVIWAVAQPLGVPTR